MSEYEEFNIHLEEGQLTEWAVTEAIGRYLGSPKNADRLKEVGDLRQLKVAIRFEFSNGNTLDLPFHEMLKEIENDFSQNVRSEAKRLLGGRFLETESRVWELEDEVAEAVRNVVQVTIERTLEEWREDRGK